jgi:hypothetical protein
MKKIYLILAILIGLNSCSKYEYEEKYEILIGSFTEVSPINERVQLEFISKTQLQRVITDVKIKTTFKIRQLNKNELVLDCNECDVESSQIVSYRILDNNKFEIGGFFPSESNDLMIFQRN